MSKWEYIVKVQPTSKMNNGIFYGSLEDNLNEYGRQGYKLVQVIPEKEATIIVLEREAD